jgi:Fe-S cluster assembly protein SufD
MTTLEATNVSEILERTNEPEWLTARRRNAWEAWQSIPMPTRKDERWRFTNLRGFDASSLEQARGAEFTLTEAVDLPTGVVWCSLSDAVADHSDLVERLYGTVVGLEDSVDDKFAAHTEAAWLSGAFLYVPKGVQVDQALTADISAVDASTWRALVVLEEGAQATYVESFTSADDAVVLNSVVEVAAGAGSHLTLVTDQRLGTEVTHFGTHRVNAARDAQVEWVAVGIGGARGKSRMETHLQGPGSNVRLTGAYVLDGAQQIDYDTRQLHEAPNAYSDLAFKGVLSGKSRAVWRGTIDVAKGAQGTDSYQDNRNLILSNGAHADSIPGLQIEANDVRCTHGSTIGKVDPEQLFYLMARGMTREQATREIVRGFFVPVLERIPEGALRESVQDAIWQRLDAVRSR